MKFHLLNKGFFKFGRDIDAPTLTALLVFAAAVTAAWPRLFFFGQLPLDGNMIALSYPNWTLSHSIWTTGHFPFWASARGLGEPCFADPQTMLAYPPQWLLSALPDFGDYLRAWVLVHTALASYFAALLARRWSRDRSAAATAAALAGGNAFFTARITFPNHFAAAAWLPAAVFALEAEHPLALGAALALQWTAGFPPFVGVTLAVLAVTAALRGRRGYETLAKGAAWGAGFAAVQWLPFLELLRLSARPTVLTGATAAQYALPASQLLKELLLPLWYSVSPSVDGDPAIVAYYTGLVAGILALLAAIRGGRRERTLAAGLAAALLLSLRAAGPLYAAIAPLRLFRFPANWLLAAAFAATMLAAAGVAALKPKHRRFAAIAVALELLAFAQFPRTAWTEPGFLSTPPALVAFTAGGLHRLYHSDRLMRSWRRSLLTSPDDYMAMREYLAPSFGTAFGVEQASSYQVLQLRSTKIFLARLEAPDGAALLDDAGIAGVLDPLLHADQAGTGQVVLRRRTTAKPRIFTDSGAATLLEHRPGYARAALSGSPSQVVLAEATYPGWRAYIDGKPVPLLNHDGEFLAVAVPPGAAEVAFRFLPASVLYGLLVSLAALALALARNSAIC